MTTQLARSPQGPAPAGPEQPRPGPGPWRRLSRWQRLVVAGATVPPAVVAGTLAAAAAGLISQATMLSVALAAGENPGMLVFGAMYLASPVQWLTGRSQIAVRKYLGIVFFVLAASNGAMFVIERGVTEVLGAPFLVAGTVALVAALPLFLTSSRRAQRAMGMRRWRTLHQGVHLVAIALVGHLVLLGDPGPGVVMIGLGIVARLPAVRRRIERRPRAAGQRRGRWRR